MSGKHEYVGAWNKTHGGCKTRLYRIWKQMRIRCYCATNPTYRYYGERGIKICDEWNDFAVFRNWALEHGYNDELSIDRIDNDGNYTPDNCRWTTRDKQIKNTRNCKYYEHNGERRTHNDWARKLGLNPSSLTERIGKHGITKALSTPKGVSCT